MPPTAPPASDLEFPRSLSDWVAASFAAFSVAPPLASGWAPITKAQVGHYIMATIREAQEAGTVHSRDWAKEALPHVELEQSRVTDMLHEKGINLQAVDWVSVQSK